MRDELAYDDGSFDEEVFDDTIEPLQLDKARLVAQLSEVRGVDTIEQVRQHIQAIYDQIEDSQSMLRALTDEQDTIEFDQAYLGNALKQIIASQTRARALYYVERLMRSVTEVRTSPINDINLNRWKEYEDILTDSLWHVPRRDSSGAHRADYWGNFIPQIPHQMMLRYTRKGEWVLDPFAGSGTTMIVAQRLGRHCVGVELQEEVVRRARRAIAGEPNADGVVSDVVVGDSTGYDYRALLGGYGQQSAQLVILHPPYFDIIRFSEDARDLSNVPSVDVFLEQIGRVIDQVAPVLDVGRYLVLVIGDTYARGEWVPLGFQTMNEVMKRGFALKSVIVKNFEETTGKRHQKELWKYRALVGGFYVFKHEYVFVLKKRRSLV